MNSEKDAATQNSRQKQQHRTELPASYLVAVTLSGSGARAASGSSEFRAVPTWAVISEEPPSSSHTGAEKGSLHLGCDWRGSRFFLKDWQPIPLIQPYLRLHFRGVNGDS